MQLTTELKQTSIFGLQLNHCIHCF